MLTGDPMEYNRYRHLLQFKDGSVYDFKTQKIVRGEPWMGINKSIPHAYEAWQFSLISEYNKVVHDIVNKFKLG